VSKSITDVSSSPVLIRFKTDYASCVYGSATVSKISAKESSTTEVFVATASCCTCSLDSLHVPIAGNPSLAINPRSWRLVFHQLHTMDVVINDPPTCRRSLFRSFCKLSAYYCIQVHLSNTLSHFFNFNGSVLVN
jgi:hypothetical protein